MSTTEGGEAPAQPAPKPQATAASKRLQQTQAQVDEVVGIMRVNIDKVLERDQKLSELDDRTGELQCNIVRLNELGTSENKTINLVVDIMRTNVEKVLERDQKLSELDDRADALQQGASQFEQQAGKLKRKFWWKNCKMWAIIIGVILVIIIIIIVVSVSN